MVDSLVDKALVGWDTMSLTETWDFTVVLWDENILQAAQNRVKSLVESWKFDDSFGSELLAIMKTTPVQKVTDSQMNSYISHALLPLIQDWRIQTIDSVKIIDRIDTTLYVEVIMTLWTFSGTIVVEVTNFIS
jgi:phage gp46-like protein